MHSIYLFGISCVLFISITTVNSCDECHSRPDEELPPISWKDCGINIRNCEPNSTVKDPNVSSRVWGGEYANTGQYPYFAYFFITHQKQIGENVYKLGDVSCGGAILNEWWILTAFHCFLNEELRTENQSIRVSIGSINRFVGRYLDVERVVMPSIPFKDMRVIQESIEEEKTLEKMIKYNQIMDENKTFINQMINKLNAILKKREDYYSQQNLGFRSLLHLWDIALVKVKHRIVPVFNKTHFKINSICLPKSGITNTRNESAVFIGMGVNEPNGIKPSNLKKGNTIILDKDFCDKRFNKLTKNELICSIEKNENELQCKGDSGSPIIQCYICQAVQIGIISHTEEIYGQCLIGYTWMTRVSIFMPWIRWVILSNDIIVISETNVLLILSVITTAIIAVIVSFALLWITVLLMRRSQNF